MLLLCDQERPINKLALELKQAAPIRNLVLLNTPKSSSASAGGIERANLECEQQVRTLRARVESAYGISIGPDHKLIPWLVRHSDGNCFSKRAELRGLARVGRQDMPSTTVPQLTSFAPCFLVYSSRSDARPRVLLQPPVTETRIMTSANCWTEKQYRSFY